MTAVSPIALMVAPAAVRRVAVAVVGAALRRALHALVHRGAEWAVGRSRKGVRRQQKTKGKAVKGQRKVEERR